MRIKPFQGLRPLETFVQDIASVPYDVVTTKEAKSLATHNPLSLLHVVRPEIDHPEGTDIYADAVYVTAKNHFERLQKWGFLVRESTPCLYIYEQEMAGRRQRGIAAVCAIEDYESNVIKKHEITRKEKEDDRTRLTHTLNANPGPVFLTYRDEKEIDTLAKNATEPSPLYTFTAPDGVKHTVWRVAGGEDCVKAFAKVPVAYVADGHHRSASAVRVGRERREANPNHTGEEDYNGFLCVLFPASQLNILPYNRVVQDLNGLKPEIFLKKVRGCCHVTENASEAPNRPHQVSLYLEGKWFGLTFDTQPIDDSPANRLDVSILQDKILAPILGIDDPRTSERIDFIGGIHGTQALTHRVDTGQAAVAFSLCPVTVDQLMDIADADQIMPPKSTWFEPKLRSGLFIHTF